MNEYTITNAFEFADEILSIPMNDEDTLVSFEVTALFADVPLSETVNILGWVAQSMVSFNHWLSSIKTNTLSSY